MAPTTVAIWSVETIVLKYWLVSLISSVIDFWLTKLIRSRFVKEADWQKHHISIFTFHLILKISLNLFTIWNLEIFESIKALLFSIFWCRCTDRGEKLMFFPSCSNKKCWRIIPVWCVVPMCCQFIYGAAEAFQWVICLSLNPYWLAIKILMCLCGSFRHFQIGRWLIAKKLLVPIVI